MRAGVAKVDITPPVGTYMCGAWTKTRSVAVHDPLYAKVLVMESGDKKVAIITCDVLLFGEEWSTPIFQAIEEKHGIKIEDIMMVPSHTHRGPYLPGDPMFGDDGAVDPLYTESAAQRIVEIVGEASENLSPVRVGCGIGTLEGFTQYRRLLLKNGLVCQSWAPHPDEDIVGPAGEPDTEVRVVKVESADGKLIAALYNFACHADGRLRFEPREQFSADYPSVTSEMIEGRHAGALGFFITGACANINGNSGEDGAIMGKALGEEVERLLKEIKTGDVSRIQSRKEHLVIPLRQAGGFPKEEIVRVFGTNESYNRIYNLDMILEVFRDGYDKLERGPKEVKTVVQVIGIGDEIAIAGLPGEIFKEFGQKIKRESPFPNTMVAELANDCVGYIPTREAFSQGGYETIYSVVSKLVPEAGYLMSDSVLGLLEEIN